MGGRISPSLSPNNSEHDDNLHWISSQSDRKLSNDNYVIDDDDDNTPCFTQEHKNTAHFGNMEEFQ